MYSVSEVAKMLNVSRVTIYRNIVTAELQQYVTTTNKVKYIDFKGIDLLKEKLGCYTKQQENSNIETIDPLHKLQVLQTEIEHLKRELESKESHINTLTNETTILQNLLQYEQEAGKDLRRLIENSQVLQKQQHDKILLLENSTTKEKKSFWDKLKR